MESYQTLARQYVEDLETASVESPARFVTGLDQIELDISKEEINREDFWDTKQAENLVVWYNDLVETALTNDVEAWLDNSNRDHKDADRIVAEVLDEYYDSGRIAPDISLDELLNT